jgi:hypothetical protein
VYHPYLLPHKFQKIHKFIAFTTACPKTQKAILVQKSKRPFWSKNPKGHFGCLRTLGVNICVPIKHSSNLGQRWLAILMKHSGIEEKGFMRASLQ